MIQYPSSTAAIRNLIDSRHKGWQGKAAERTRQLQIAGKYIKKGGRLPNGKEATEFWNVIKDVFITTQYAKCIYCEMHLEMSTIQWDLEHFRPKDAVKEWLSSFLTGPEMPGGYYLLAYDIENYAASCKVCNSVYKQSYFPIANARIADTVTVAAHAGEGAFLLYPLGDNADDPAQHIMFNDVEAKPKNGSIRGEVTIQLLELNREALQIERANWLINTFWNAYEGAAGGRDKSLKTLAYLLSHKAPHANCTRCFFVLCQSDPEEASRRYEKMYRILQADA